jgi:hypothetical protein
MVVLNRRWMELRKDSQMDLQKDPLTGLQVDHTTQMVDSKHFWTGLGRTR